MKLLNALEKKFGHLAIPNLTNILIFGNVFAYIIVNLYPTLNTLFTLQGNLLLNGQWFRLLTFIFEPFADAPIWIVLGWYLAYIFGNALNLIWGSFRYTLYLTLAYVLTILCAFLFPSQILGNGYIFTSIFLAFAYLNPDFILHLFFIIPIKIKWLAIVAWISIFYMIVTGPVVSKIVSLISIANFLLFFGEDIALTLLHKKNPIKKALTETLSKRESYMHCATCKKTEHDKKIFSYCKSCNPETQYCEDHINSHQHKT